VRIRVSMGKHLADTDSDVAGLGGRGGLTRVDNKRKIRTEMAKKFVYLLALVVLLLTVAKTLRGENHRSPFVIDHGRAAYDQSTVVHQIAPTLLRRFYAC
jgi:hypothetical protein